jgi:hypothetical protein
VFIVLLPAFVGELPDALGPVGALADAEDLLDPLVVRAEVLDPERLAAVAEETARVVPLRELEVVGAEGDLRVHRRGPAHAAAAEHRHRSSGAAVDHRHPQGPPEVVRGLRLPADEVGGRQMGAGLEQHDPAAALRKLAGDHTAAGARSDDDDVDALAHPGIPM